MKTKVIFKYVFLSVIPMVMAKGAIFFANIVTSNQVTAKNFSDLSAIYLCVAIMATPIISAINQYMSVANVTIRKLVQITFFFSLFTSALSSIYYSFFFSDLFDINHVAIVFIFTIILVISGSVSSIFIGAGKADKLNVSSLIGGVCFTFITVCFVSVQVEWYYFLVLYAVIPLVNILISPFLIRKHFEKISQNSSPVGSNIIISKLLLITLMGAPIQLILVALLRGVDISGNELARLNIAYQWHMLIIILPTMISAILLKFLTERNSAIHRVYRKLSYHISFGLGLLIIMISSEIEGLYGDNGVGVSNAIVGYAIAGVLSVIYHVRLNTFLSESAFNNAMKMVGINAIVYLFSGGVGLLYSPHTLTLASCMSLSYCITLILTKSYIR